MDNYTITTTPNPLRAILLSFIFFTLTPLTLGISLFSLLTLSNTPKPKVLSAHTSNPSGAQVFASLPNSQPAISGEATAADARVEIVKQYLERYNSPLEPYANKIVEAADKYGLDFRLITAIAQQESNLCKFIPAETYNCWGWGIHSRGTLGFTSFEDGIETVSQGLREKYIDEGLNTPEELMSKYTPLSPGSWAVGVSAFMEEMQ